LIVSSVRAATAARDVICQRKGTAIWRFCQPRETASIFIFRAAAQRR
jgi:hypothetical protein